MGPHAWQRLCCDGFVVRTLAWTELHLPGFSFLYVSGQGGRLADPRDIVAMLGLTHLFRSGLSWCEAAAEPESSVSFSDTWARFV